MGNGGASPHYVIKSVFVSQLFVQLLYLPYIPKRLHSSYDPPTRIPENGGRDLYGNAVTGRFEYVKA